MQAQSVFYQSSFFRDALMHPKYNVFMKVILFIFCLLMLGACNQVNDLQPDLPGIPEEAIGVVKKEFPNATDIILKTLLDKKIWEVKFTSEKNRYTSLANTSKMWETFRANHDSVPALLGELLGGTSFQGGTFSVNSEDIAFYSTGERRNRLVYSFKGTDYVFDWQRYNGQNYRPTSANFEFAMYKLAINDFQDFPTTVKDYILADKGLAFLNGEIRILLNYEKQYVIRVNFTKNDKLLTGTMLFDEKGALRWISREFNQPDQYSPESNIDSFPDPIARILEQSEELKSFQYQSPETDKWRGEYNGVTSYYLKLRNKGNAEVCELYFDKDGILLNKRYFVSF